MKEKEIIDKLKELQNDSFEWTGGEDLIDFIKKLQKENEELKKPKDNIQVVYSGRNYGKTNSILKEYISKDKIREVLNKDKDYICADRITQDIKKLLEEE